MVSCAIDGNNVWWRRALQATDRAWNYWRHWIVRAWRRTMEWNGMIIKEPWQVAPHFEEFWFRCLSLLGDGVDEVKVLQIGFKDSSCLIRSAWTLPNQHACLSSRSQQVLRNGNDDVTSVVSNIDDQELSCKRWLSWSVLPDQTWQMAMRGLCWLHRLLPLGSGIKSIL